MKKPFCGLAQRVHPCMPSTYTYASNDCCIILLTIIHGNWLIVRASREYATVVVDSRRYELLSVWCISKVGCAGSI
jgi:hypothetical protein